MNIQQVQNNNPAFGMALKFNGTGEKRLQQMLSGWKRQYQDEFVTTVLNPIKRLVNQDVIIDSERVLVRDNVSGRQLEVLNEHNGRLPYADEFVSGRSTQKDGKLRPVILSDNQFLAHVKENNAVSEVILNTDGKTAEEEVRNNAGLVLKLNIARRLAEYFNKV